MTTCELVGISGNGERLFMWDKTSSDKSSFITLDNKGKSSSSPSLFILFSSSLFFSFCLEREKQDGLVLMDICKEGS